MPSASKKPQTLYDKVFSEHVVDEKADGTILLYIGLSWSRPPSLGHQADPGSDRHLVHEVTSPVSPGDVDTIDDP